MSTPTSPRNLVSIQSYADSKGISTKTARRLISEGAIPAYRLPGRSRLIRIDADEADAALERVPNGSLCGGTE